jgi:phage baseplate assembly protein W
LALSPFGDLIFSPSLDVMGISGTNLIEQRMMIRLRVQRGSWTYDDNDSFGSQLHQLMGANSTTAMAQIDAYVREALRDMTDIVITNVNVRVEPITQAVTLLIDYNVLDETGQETEQQLTFAVSEGSA